ncbi:hypothetical protein PPUN109347_37220 [Pseudomonas putida]|nr:hypothetical protein PPUN109347_37220 [Pseudomonas putida]
MGQSGLPGSGSVHVVVSAVSGRTAAPTGTAHMNQIRLWPVPGHSCNQLAKRHADFDIFDNAMIHKVYLHYVADLVESAPDREVTKGSITGYSSW